jgi:hypothetical protein
MAKCMVKSVIQNKVKFFKLGLINPNNSESDC